MVAEVLVEVVDAVEVEMLVVTEAVVAERAEGWGTARVAIGFLLEVQTDAAAEMVEDWVA